MNLAAFVTARLDEDAELARGAGNGDEWTYAPALTWNGPAGPRQAVVSFQGSAMHYVAVVDPVHGEAGAEEARHIERHDPRAIRRSVDARRRTVERHSECGSGAGYCDGGGHGWDDLPGGGCADLADLARPHADHPDYRSEWWPE